jgi:nucleotide-binding universal stress UspA family protein
VPLEPEHNVEVAAARGRQERQALLERVAATLVVSPTTHLGQHIGIDSPESLLLRLSEQADLTVLGQDHHSLVGRASLGHTASTVASRSRRPVVAVPRDWTERVDYRRPIAVAIDGRHPADSTLTFAFTEASMRRAPVLVVHSAAMSEQALGEQASRLNLAEILAGWKADYPDVEVDIMLVPGPPRDTVAAEANRAQLLVVGGPYRGQEWTRWIRSVARAVLGQASRPVAVIPQQHHRWATTD